MLKITKKDLWNILCVIWAMAVALFWFAMRVIWSGISKVLYEAMGKKEPTEFLLNLPLYISVFLWVLFAFTVLKLVRKGCKKWSNIVLTVLLSVFTVASAVVVVMGAVDYLYFILPKFGISLLISLCIAAFAAILFWPPMNAAVSPKRLTPPLKPASMGLKRKTSKGCLVESLPMSDAILSANSSASAVKTR